MIIRVYGKKGCAGCDAMKKWLEEKKVPYEFCDVVDFPEDWREKGFADAMALSARLTDVLPIVYVEGERRPFQTAEAAQKVIERRVGNVGGLGGGSRAGDRVAGE